MRTFIIATLVFFLLAPSTLAESNTPPIGNVNTPPIGNIAPSTNISPAGSNITLINPLKGVDCSKSGGDCLMAFLQNILEFVISIGTIVVILMMVFVGYKFVVAQGNPGEIEKAKQMLLWTVVGALILLGSQAIAISLKATVAAITGP